MYPKKTNQLPRPSRDEVLASLRQNKLDALAKVGRLQQVEATQLKQASRGSVLMMNDESEKREVKVEMKAKTDETCHVPVNKVAELCRMTKYGMRVPGIEATNHDDAAAVRSKRLQELASSRATMVDEVRPRNVPIGIMAPRVVVEQSRVGSTVVINSSKVVMSMPSPTDIAVGQILDGASDGQMELKELFKIGSDESMELSTLDEGVRASVFGAVDQIIRTQVTGMLRQNLLTKVHVAGDGHCFYHALSYGLCSRYMHWPNVRAFVAKCMIREEYPVADIAEVLDSSMWGSQNFAEAICSQFNICVAIVMPGGRELGVLLPSRNLPVGLVLLSHSSGNHFDVYELQYLIGVGLNAKIRSQMTDEIQSSGEGVIITIGRTSSIVKINRQWVLPSKINVVKDVADDPIDNLGSDLIATVTGKLVVCKYMNECERFAAECYASVFSDLSEKSSLGSMSVFQDGTEYVQGIWFGAGSTQARVKLLELHAQCGELQVHTPAVSDLTFRDEEECSEKSNNEQSGSISARMISKSASNLRAAINSLKAEYPTMEVLDVSNRDVIELSRVYKIDVVEVMCSLYNMINELGIKGRFSGQLKVPITREGKLYAEVSPKGRRGKDVRRLLDPSDPLEITDEPTYLGSLLGFDTMNGNAIAGHLPESPFTVAVWAGINVIQLDFDQNLITAVRVVDSPEYVVIGLMCGVWTRAAIESHHLRALMNGGGFTPAVGLCDLLRAQRLPRPELKVMCNIQFNQEYQVNSYGAVMSFGVKGDFLKLNSHNQSYSQPLLKTSDEAQAEATLEPDQRIISEKTYRGSRMRRYQVKGDDGSSFIFGMPEESRWSNFTWQRVIEFEDHVGKRCLVIRGTVFDVSLNLDVEIVMLRPAGLYCCPLVIRTTLESGEEYCDRFSEPFFNGLTIFNSFVELRNDTLDYLSVSSLKSYVPRRNFLVVGNKEMPTVSGCLKCSVSELSDWYDHDPLMVSEGSRYLQTNCGQELLPVTSGRAHLHLCNLGWLSKRALDSFGIFSPSADAMRSVIAYLEDTIAYALQARTEEY